MATTRETREKKVSKVVMVPLIISHDGAVLKDIVKRWKDFAADIKVDWVRMAQSVLRYNVAIIGRFFNKGNWVSDALMSAYPQELEEETEGAPERIPTAEERREEPRLNLVHSGALCVCGPRARHLHMAFG